MLFKAKIYLGWTQYVWCFIRLLCLSISLNRRKIRRKIHSSSKLLLIGDNACMNSLYMCTPRGNVSSEPKDWMNCFHSSLQVWIECAFAILVNIWGFLHKPMSVNLTVHKISTFVLALCKSHNYCIDNSSEEVDCMSDQDIISITMDAGLFFPRLDNGGE